MCDLDFHMVYILSIFIFIFFCTERSSTNIFHECQGNTQSPISFKNINEICSNLILEDGVLNEGAVEDVKKKCSKKETEASEVEGMPWRGQWGRRCQQAIARWEYLGGTRTLIKGDARKGSWTWQWRAFKGRLKILNFIKILWKYLGNHFHHHHPNKFKSPGNQSEDNTSLLLFLNYLSNSKGLNHSLPKAM